MSEFVNQPEWYMQGYQACIEDLLRWLVKMNKVYDKSIPISEVKHELNERLKKIIINGE